MKRETERETKREAKGETESNPFPKTNQMD